MHVRMMLHLLDFDDHIGDEERAAGAMDEGRLPKRTDCWELEWSQHLERNLILPRNRRLTSKQGKEVSK